MSGCAVFLTLLLLPVVAVSAEGGFIIIEQPSLRYTFRPEDVGPTGVVRNRGTRGAEWNGQIALRWQQAPFAQPVVEMLTQDLYSRGVSSLYTCFDSQIVVPALQNFDWNRGFTVVITYKPNYAMLYRPMFIYGNGIGPFASLYEELMTEGGTWSHLKPVVNLPLMDTAMLGRWNITGEFQYGWVTSAIGMHNCTSRVLLNGVVSYATVEPVHHDTGSDMCSIPTQASPFYIGGFGPHSVNSFCGRVHEVRVYERLLTLTELQVVSGATQTELRVGDVGGYFMDVDCMVTAWSEWSPCEPVTSRFDPDWGATTLPNNTQPHFRTRTRQRLGGTFSTCPPFTDLELCTPPTPATSTLTQPIDFVSQYGQDSVVLNLCFRDDTGEYKHNGVFVDVGAFDGVTISNSWVFERYLNWTGVCVEPLAEPFAKLTRDRSCLAINAAAYHTNTTLTFNVVDDGPMLSGIKSQYTHQHASYIESLNYTSREVSVPAVRLQDVFDAQGIEFVDLLTIDTENSELLVLEGIDFAKVYVDVIVVEQLYASESQPLFHKLDQLGFELLGKVTLDLVFRNRRSMAVRYGHTHAPVASP